jgi:drug/metabolite transporter (DMT)-like permease
MNGAEGSAAMPFSQPVRLPVGTWLLNRYWLILLGAVLDSAGEVLLKKGANSVAAAGIAPTFFAAPLLSGWTWLGIISYVTSLVSWLYVLRKIPLSVAFPLINVVHVLVPLGATLFLHEYVSWRMWAGISLILLGVIAIVKPVVHAEEKL